MDKVLWFCWLTYVSFIAGSVWFLPEPESFNLRINDIPSTPHPLPPHSLQITVFHPNSFWLNDDIEFFYAEVIFFTLAWCSGFYNVDQFLCSSYEL